MHGYYKDYLYKMKRFSTSLYSCKKVETFRHLILGYPKLAKVRAKLKDSLNTSRLTLLLL